LQGKEGIVSGKADHHHAYVQWDDGKMMIHKNDLEKII
jgi:hypothetical protein